MAKRTVTGDVVETECTVTLMPVLGDSAPLGATLQTNEVAAALTSDAPRTPSSLVSRPVSIFTPPKGQLAPAGSSLVATNELCPLLPLLPLPPSHT